MTPTARLQMTAERLHRESENQLRKLRRELRNCRDVFWRIYRGSIHSSLADIAYEIARIDRALKPGKRAK